jgi:DNA-binding CsgD family transcriptional regulator
MNKFSIFKIISTLLLFFQINILFSQEIIIKNGDFWSYYDKGYLENDWVKPIDFSNWKTGKSPLGYGDTKIITKLSFGSDKKKKHIIKYFKKKIFIKNKSVAYEFRIQRDDGAVVYINGTEVFRDNMPNSTINNTTIATNTVQREEEHLFKQHFFDNSILKNGENIISVSIHQSYSTSSDCIFSLELIGHNNSDVLTFVVENKNKTNQELESKIKDLNAKFEYDKITLQKEGLQSTNYNLKVLVFLISILFIMALIGYYFILENSKKRAQEKNDKIISLNLDSINKDKEMISLSTNLLHHKQYFKEIKADLKGLKTSDKAIIKDIINQIDYVLDRDEDWGILKKHFNAVHDNFYDKLIAKHPTISETELRHCMFIKLHMQTKEISKILLIDPRSVQTARYRIKKKMNLNEDEDLRDYLLNLD